MPYEEQHPVPPTAVDDEPTVARRMLARPAFTAFVALVAMGLTPLTLPVFGAPTTKIAAVDDPGVPVPPDDKAWIQGVLTDQAGRPLDNVNVEVWPTDPGAIEPVGSNLTYAGVSEDARFAHGVYRVEVPLDQAYRIVFSAVHGKEDGDDYRMKSYGHGRPLMVRYATRTRWATRDSKAALVPGAVRDLGTTQLVHQGKVRSGIKVKLLRAKVAPGTRGKLRVKVSSAFISNPVGKVVIKVSGRKLTDRLTARDRGTSVQKLPRLSAGNYKVRASFKGTGTIASSRAKPIKLKVRNR